jgi:hypothetical protein
MIIPRIQRGMMGAVMSIWDEEELLSVIRLAEIIFWSVPGELGS